MTKYLIYKVQIVDKAAYDACDFDKALKTTDIEIYECDLLSEVSKRCRELSAICPGSSFYNPTPEVSAKTPVTFYYKPINNSDPRFLGDALPHLEASGQAALNL